VDRDDKTEIKAAIITLSDKGAEGEREDLSGKVIFDFVESMGGVIVSYDIIPDEADRLRDILIEKADGGKVNLILTTGGTGLSPRDITPEVTLSVSDREVPGFAEAMRQKSLEVTPHAMLSRAVSVMRKKTLIINLPGSPNAVGECLEVIAPALHHAISKACGDTSDCARE
jgi:molybdenum cofactor synthesis domain-containing protein